MQPPQGAVGGPAGEVVVDGAPVRVALGQGPPRAAGPRHVQARVTSARRQVRGGLAGQGQSAGRAAAGRAAALGVGQIGGEPTRWQGTGAAGMESSSSRRGTADRWWGWHATAMSDTDDLAALLGAPATPAQRRRQQASQARFDHALGWSSRPPRPPAPATSRRSRRRWPACSRWPLTTSSSTIARRRPGLPAV